MLSEAVGMEELSRVFSQLAQPDAAVQQQGLALVERLKSSEDGWKLCAAAIFSDSGGCDHYVHFYCLQVIEHYVQTRYVNNTSQEKCLVRSFIQKWTECQCGGAGGGATSLPLFVRNKMAHLCCEVFVRDYPHHWPGMLLDMTSLTGLGTPAVDLLLRTLLHIDGEIVDREIVHCETAQARNTLIRDSMRVQCVPQLVQCWARLVPLCRTQQPELAALCLDVVGKYTTWIDVALVVNEPFVAMLRESLQFSGVRHAAVDCIHDIVLKGMEPLAKARLVESFYEELQRAGLFRLAAVANDDTSADDVDFLCRLGRLLGALGSQLVVEVYRRLARSCGGAQQQSQQQQETRRVLDEIQAAIRAKVAPLLQFLNCDYDEPSQSVLAFARDYVQLLKSMPCVQTADAELLRDMTLVVINKMKFSRDYDFDDPGEDEADFDEFRKRLKVLYDNLAGASRQLVLSVTEQYVADCLHNWRQRDMADVEAAVSMLYLLGEALPPVSTGNFFSDDPAKASVLQSLMEKLVTSDVVHFPHHVVPFQYFETVCRYEKFFTVRTDMLPKVLGEFLSEVGINHRRPRNTGRCVYLFSRFVRALRVHLECYTERVLQQLVPLLSTSADATTPAEAGPCRVSRDDQLYLYETVAVLVVSSTTASNKLKCERLRTLLVGAVAEFSALAAALVAGSCGQQLSAAEHVTRLALARHCVAVVTRSTKAFSSGQTMRMTGATPIYLEALTAFLEPVQRPGCPSQLQSAVVQYLHRLLVCMDDEVVRVFLPAAHSLLDNADSRRLQEFLPLINQVVAKHKGSDVFERDIVPYLVQLFWPLCQLISGHLSDNSGDKNDELATRERESLRRAHLLFLSTLVSNGATRVLASQQVDHLLAVLQHVVDAAVNCSDPVAQKCCFTVLRRLTDAWACPNSAHTSATASSDDVSALFVRFVYDHVVPACFLAPLQPNFDLGDAQTVLALQESACCLRAVYQQRGDELVNFLQQRYMKDILRVRSDTIQEYCNALRSDNKAFKNYTKVFFQMSRT